MYARQTTRNTRFFIRKWMENVPANCDLSASRSRIDYGEQSADGGGFGDAADGQDKRRRAGGRGYLRMDS